MFDNDSMPEEAEFILFFESNPVNAVPEDGYWSYQYSDSKNGVLLNFSINTHEASLQTQLVLNGKIIETVSCEYLNKIQISENAINAEFKNGETKLKCGLKPSISISWSTLRQ